MISAFGVDHGIVSKGFWDTTAVALSPIPGTEALVAPKGNKTRSVTYSSAASWPGKLAGAAIGGKVKGPKGAAVGYLAGGNATGAAGYVAAQRKFKRLQAQKGQS